MFGYYIGAEAIAAVVAAIAALIVHGPGPHYDINKEIGRGRASGGITQVHLAYCILPCLYCVLCCLDCALYRRAGVVDPPNFCTTLALYLYYISQC